MNSFATISGQKWFIGEQVLFPTNLEREGSSKNSFLRLRSRASVLSWPLNKLIRKAKILGNGCNHILPQCPLVHILWSMAYGLLQISGVMTVNVKEEIWKWKCVSGRKKHLGLIPLAIFWVMWKERNKRAFKVVEEDLIGLELGGFKPWNF